MGAIASQITSLTIVYSIVYSVADQRKHQSSASLAFVLGIHRTGEFPAQRANNAENVSIWWRHHVHQKGDVWYMVICFRNAHLTMLISKYTMMHRCWRRFPSGHYIRDNAMRRQIDEWWLKRPMNHSTSCQEKWKVFKYVWDYSDKIVLLYYVPQ